MKTQPPENEPFDGVHLIREPRRNSTRQPRIMMTDEFRQPDTTPPLRAPRRANAASGAAATSKPDTAKAKARRRILLGIALAAVGLLLALALVSYTRADQANTDVKPNEFIGLLTNDGSISPKFDTTQNWIGLLGAILANFFINGTVGFASMAIPVLCVLWGIACVRNSAGKKLALITTYTLAGTIVLAAFVGTLQRIRWMPEIPPELSGNIGQFLASAFSHVIGTAGAALSLLVVGFILAIVAFDADIHHTLLRVKLFIASVKDTLDTRKAMRRTKKEEVAAANAAAAEGEQMALLESENGENDEEPARLVRRQARKQAKIEDPQIKRPQPTTIAKPTPKPADEKQDEQKNPSPPRQMVPLTRDDQRKFVESQTQDELPPDSPRTKEEELSAVSQKGNESNAAAEESITPVPAETTMYSAGAASQESTPEENTTLTLRVQETEPEERAEDGTVADFNSEEIDYTPPGIELLAESEQEEVALVSDEELKEHARILQEKLATFNVLIEDVQVTPGPVVTLYEFVPASGIKIAQIEALQDDIALAMKARGIRIIAPIPGKGTVGVEIPNDKPVTVHLRGLVGTTAFREYSAALPLALGKTTIGETFFADLATMPHLLIAGATGAGKSVGINSMLLSILYKRHPGEVKFMIIDPKKIELSTYAALKKHFLAVCPDINEDIITTPQNAVIALKCAELEMERRYDLLAKAGVRHLTNYNEHIASGKVKPSPGVPHRKLPYIVIVIDELADLMITAAHDVEEPIARLAQLARAVGMHLLVATQRPSVDVITGVIKANFASRIAYAVASRIDSRTILDGSGAEQLLGKGDMLFLSSASPKPIRLQNPLVTTEEIDAVAGFIAAQQGYSHPYTLPSVVEKKNTESIGGGGGRDDLFDEAARLVVRHQQGSVSLLQRRLKVGYSRAARIIDKLESAGIVGPFDGSKAREVLIQDDETLEAQLGA